MPHEMLCEFAEAMAARFGIPGVAAGVWVDGGRITRATADQRGFFTRDANRAVVDVDLAGRLFSRVPAEHK
jgi:hypothetical protein